MKGFSAKLKEFIKNEMKGEQKQLKSTTEIGRNDLCFCRKRKKIQKVLYE